MCANISLHLLIDPQCKTMMEDGKRKLQRKTDELSAQQGPLKYAPHPLAAMFAVWQPTMQNLRVQALRFCRPAG